MSDPIARMHNAQRLLDDELFKEAWAKVEEAILAELRGPPTGRDTELLIALRMVPTVKNWLIGQIQTGKIELHDRNQKERK